MVFRVMDKGRRRRRSGNWLHTGVQEGFIQGARVMQEKGACSHLLLWGDRRVNAIYIHHDPGL